MFLHGYNEPTLLLLHEAEASWSGFACERKDTCTPDLLFSEQAYACRENLAMSECSCCADIVVASARSCDE